VQDFRRNGSYTLAALLGGGGVTWLATWGDTVASAAKGSSTNFWVPATYAAVAGFTVAVLIILAVMFNWRPRLWRRVTRHEEPGQQVPDKTEGSTPPVSPPQRVATDTVSLRDFFISGDSEFELGSSAEILAEGGGVFDRAKFHAQHLPGHPELFGRDGGSQDG